MLYGFIDAMLPLGRQALPSRAPTDGAIGQEARGA